MEKHYEEPTWSSCLSKPLILEVIKEGIVINTLELVGKPYFLVGRTPDCDIQLDHPSVSRFHAVIQTNETQMYLYDMESTHGTFLNKQKLEPKKYYPFHVGEPFRFGLSTRQFVLAYETGEDEEQPLSQETSDYLASSSGREYIRKELQRNDEPTCDWDDDNIVEVEEEEELFETKDEERQRLEALGGFEDVLGANYGDDSDDEFYDRTGNGTLIKPTIVSHNHNDLSHEKRETFAYEGMQEHDELELFMEQNQQALQAQRKDTLILSNKSNYSDRTNPLESFSNRTKKEENVDDKEEEEKIPRKRARIPYGPTRASLPVYDEKLILAQMSDPDRDWQPPSGQSGDGKTRLNDILHY